MGPKVLWPYGAKVLSKKNDNLIMTVAAGTVALNIIYASFLLIDGLIENDEKVAFSKRHTLKTRGQKPYS